MVCLAGCSTQKAPGEFPALAEEFVYGSLALAPASATAAGYHRHGGVALDEQLDDWSEAGVERQRRFYRDINVRLDRFDAATLSPEDQADHAVMKDQVALALLELDTIQEWRHKPTFYVELVGNALFSPFVLEYAPKPARYRAIIARLEKLPAFLEQAKKNLADSPEIWTTVAREENEGNIGLIDGPLRAGAPAESAPALRPGRDAGHPRAAGVQPIPVERSGQAPGRLAAGRGEVRAQVPPCARHGQAARGPAGGSRSRSQGRPQTDVGPGPAAAPQALSGAQGPGRPEPDRRRDAGQNRRAPFHARPVLRRRAARPRGSARVRQEEEPAGVAAARQPAGDRDAGVHARHLFGRRVQLRRRRSNRSLGRSTG